MRLVPLTFVFDMDEPNFHEKLQDFSKFFLSVQQNKPLSEIKSVGTREDYKGS